MKGGVPPEDNLQRQSLSLFAEMESGVPMLNCLLLHTLRNLCSCSDSSNPSSKWVYAIFWRILPRNFPPPKWEYDGSILDRSKGNKRNWILVWEDGYCDFYDCERERSRSIKGKFGAELFFKMSHEVYSFGEGLVGKVAADNSHRWVFRENPNETDPNFNSAWNSATEPQPRVWESHFESGIQTIAIIAVGEGMVQLGSFHKISEDLNLVRSVQRKFSYLQSIPGIFTAQRPYLPSQNPNFPKQNAAIVETQDEAFPSYSKRNTTGMKRLFSEIHNDSPLKTINLGWNTLQNSISESPITRTPFLSQSTSCQMAKISSADVKLESSCYENEDGEEKPISSNPSMRFVVSRGGTNQSSRNL